MNANKYEELLSNLAVLAKSAKAENDRLPQPNTPISPTSHFSKLLITLEIISRLEQSATASAVASAPAADQKESWKRFEEWIESNGRQVSMKNFGVRFADGLEQGSGVIATKDFKEGELIFQIPQDLFLSTQVAYEAQKIYSPTLAETLRQMPTLSLSYHLICERRFQSSFWKPYIDILPKNFNTGLSLRNKDFTLLENSPTFVDAKRLIMSTSMQFAMLRDLLQKEEEKWTNQQPHDRYAPLIRSADLKMSEFVWAMGAVMSRQNRVPGSEGNHELCLIPAWDMCNHKQGKITTGFDEETKSLVCYAQSDLVSDNQIFIHYGDRPNSELFLYMGFVSEENDADFVKLYIPPPSIPSAILCKFPYLGKTVEVKIPSSMKTKLDFPEGLMAPFRAQALYNAGIVNPNAYTNVFEKIGGTNESEIRALELLADFVQSKIDAYQQSIEDSSQVIALLFSSEKKVLTNMLSLINKERKKMLDKEKKKEKERQRKTGKK